MTNIRRRLAALVLAVLAVLAVSPAQPAAAARSIAAPSGLACERYDNRLSVSPPRVWASYGTEQVVWTVLVQRYSGSGWYTYSRHSVWASFNYYGQNVTGWSTGWYANNTLNIPVYHRGYYRLAAAVNGTQGGATWAGLVDGGRYCYVY